MGRCCVGSTTGRAGWLPPGVPLQRAERGHGSGVHQWSDAGETDAPEIIRFSYDRLGRMLTEETAQGVLTHQYD
ncbi:MULTISPECIES: hypothetical protein [unclassified Escherichia]|uniref:hypothetical protein n=1 Tax=unclassified Escherichia TaxID=2608889 RepID=UPI001F0F4BE0|nr:MULTISPECIES: hypothetical protein [unclassified Escherichia]